MQQHTAEPVGSDAPQQKRIDALRAALKKFEELRKNAPQAEDGGLWDGYYHACKGLEQDINWLVMQQEAA